MLSPNEGKTLSTFLEVAGSQLASHAAGSPLVGEAQSVQRRGSYRDQTVVASQSLSKLSARQIAPAARQHPVDRLSLHRRDLRQGQAASFAATARIADYYDKLPQMPQTEALLHLISLFEAMSRHDSGSAPEILAEPLLLNGDGSDSPAVSGAADANEMRVGGTRAHSDGSGESSSGDQRSGYGPASGSEDIFAALQAFDPDVTHQYAALDILREHFSQVPAPEGFIRRLEQAAQVFEQTDIARDVRAGMAAARVADEAAQTLATDPAAFRNSYRAMLRERKDIGQLFDILSRFDLTMKFEAVIELFRTAAGHDLASIGPSTDRRFLHHLLGELGKLKKMQSTYEMTRNLIVITERVLAARERGTATAVDLTSRLLNFAGRTAPSLADARTLIEPMRSVNLMGQVVFANGLRGIHVALPDDLIPSGAARIQQAVMLRALQDALVSEEEANYS